QWLHEEQPKVLPKSPMGQAIAYALRHWQALTRYLDDGFLDIDNNLAELTLRHIAIGRKNWLFAGNPKGAETAAILFSVTSTCHGHGVDALAYLRDLLERLAPRPLATATARRAGQLLKLNRGPAGAHPLAPLPALREVIAVYDVTPVNLVCAERIRNLLRFTSGPV